MRRRGDFSCSTTRRTLSSEQLPTWTGCLYCTLRRPSNNPLTYSLTLFTCTCTLEFRRTSYVYITLLRRRERSWQKLTHGGQFSRAEDPVSCKIWACDLCCKASRQRFPKTFFTLFPVRHRGRWKFRQQRLGSGLSLSWRLASPFVLVTAVHLRILTSMAFAIRYVMTKLAAIISYLTVSFCSRPLPGRPASDR